MRWRAYAVCMFVAACLDVWLTFVFPPDYTYQKLSFIPHICFLVCMMAIYDRKPIDRVLIGALCGILYDFFFGSTFPVSFLLFAAFGYTTGLFKENYDKDMRLLFVVLSAEVFLLDTLPFLFCKIIGTMHVNVGTWLLHMELLTVAIHIAVIYGLMYVLDAVDAWAARREEKRDQQRRNSYRDAE
ncbi:rod shape-determining protein MreD [Catenisphaera adipataccumulans]|jgi:rod shape-determining protein MreD|uniref:Rod shape-determining protein MreD n=1 Tax=Catenisphaera adipataccumulans TaxID=700500 RepID=A0A7W8D1F2_9FIRM|nr:rod shape-determining protein MreD [Catenisphaera adipataccumulans]MBB5183785.1 rod shape-determining protein MreD [Catenisphaera adipataccumulans]